MEHISFDEREDFIWFNGKLIKSKEAKIHVLNHGLHYASTVFEGERSYNGKIFESRKHSERLINSAMILGMKIPFSVDQIETAKKDLISVLKLDNAYVRAVAWSGSEKMTIAAPKNSINLAIAAWEWPFFYDSKSDGISLCISKWVRPDPRSAPTDSKASGLYMISSMSKNDAANLGYDDALMLDYRGYVAEGTAANFFMVKNSEIHTPIADCFLNGITRQTIIKLAKKRNIKVTERYIYPEELSSIDEAFLTGTAAEITPISSIEDNKYNNHRPITKSLMNDYKDLVYK